MKRPFPGVKAIVLSLFASMALAGCGDQGDVVGVAKGNILATTPYPETVEFIDVSKPDSAFGVTYLTENEVVEILTTMQKVTEIILGKDLSFKDPGEEDPYLVSLTERHMESAATIRSILLNSEHKGPWSGWKLSVKYSAKDANGTTYTNTRWLFANREGTAIQKYFDVPNP